MVLPNIKAFESAIQTQHKDAVVEIKGLPTTQKTGVLALTLFITTLFICASVVAFHANQEVVGFALVGGAPLSLAIYPIYKKNASTPFEREVDQFLSNEEDFKFLKENSLIGWGYSNDRFDVYVEKTETQMNEEGSKKIGRKISFVERKTPAFILNLPLGKVIN